MYPFNTGIRWAPNLPFQCRSCGYTGYAMIVNKISTAGWIVFAMMLLFCIPLFWIGLLITENKSQCPNCKVEI
jgi:hypothetical protein